jgi:hypothetical protein
VQLRKQAQYNAAVGHAQHVISSSSTEYGNWRRSARSAAPIALVLIPRAQNNYCSLH